MAESSADAKNTSAPSPNLFGEFLVDVDTTVELASTLAWLPIHREHPGSSVLAQIHQTHYKYLLPSAAFHPFLLEEQPII